MSKKILFIGRTGSGKTTLCQKLNQIDFKDKKTQAVEYYSNAIDTPGEFIENRNLYHGFLITAVDANIIGIVGDPTVEENYIPPALAGTFAKEVIGIITKVTLVKDKKQIQNVKEQLEMAGVSSIFLVDTIKNIGMKKLFAYLKDDKENEVIG